MAKSKVDTQELNTARAEAILIMTSIVRVGQSKFSAVPIDEDSQERIMNCVETLAQLQTSVIMNEIFLHDTKAAYAKMVATEEVSFKLSLSADGEQKKAIAKKELENKTVTIQADDLISFRQLSKKTAGGDADDVSMP